MNESDQQDIWHSDIISLVLPKATPNSTRDLDEVAATLLGRTSRLTRLLMRTGPRELTRSESGLLATVAEGQRTIGELTESEGLVQSAVSKLVERLERRSLVTRQRAVRDGRIVLVTITPVGAATLERTREHIRERMRDALRELPAGDLATLLATGDVLERLIQQLESQGRVQ